MNIYNEELAGLYSEPGVIRTFTGKYINVFDPQPHDICLEDIAHALSNLCRFGGHTRQFYSVAEHSIRTAKFVEPPYRLAALLHDASEAYLLDIPTPVKIMFPEYHKAEYRMMEVIAEKFGFEYPLSDEVRMADKLMLQLEWLEFMTGSQDYDPRTSAEVRIDFISAFDSICIANKKRKTVKRDLYNANI